MGKRMAAEFTFSPLTPVAFLERSASAFADRPAVIDGGVRLTYRELADRVSRGMSALAADGIGQGDRVAALCANSHVMIELHNMVPARGAALVPVNVRLSADEIVYIVEHSGAKLLVATDEFAETARDVAGRVGLRLLIAGGEGDHYEAWLASADPADQDANVIEEDQLLAINYTSGTTGKPKGVMYHHRGAYLQAVAMAYHLGLGPGSRYLWVLPMFHCDGWCLTWAVTASGGTHVCLRAVDPAEIWRQLSAGGISHFSGAPTVLTMITEYPSAAVLAQRVHVSTGGAPPSPALLARMEPLGMDITHLYG
jgi:fatty-acyl-CoA synthase